MKRIFHWNAEENRFEVVKVNSAQGGQYETHADIRLFAGLVRRLFLHRRIYADFHPGLVIPRTTCIDSHPFLYHF